MPDGSGLLFGSTTPIAYPIDKSTENYERDTLAELQKALAKAEEKDQAALKEEMAYYQEAVAFYDNQPPYVIDTPALEDYQQNLAPYLFISPFNPISQLYEEYPELFTKVEEGEITPQFFLQELEQKVDMMVKEFD